VASTVTPPPAGTAGSAARPAPPQRDEPAQQLPQVLPRRGWALAGPVLGAVVVLVGVVGRFLAPRGLWLDEALSANIAKLPLGQLPGALVQDGSPPLYYVLLHFWVLVFGQGGFAVRALSGVVSVATLPLLWMAGKRVGGPRAAVAALLLGASSPWAIYYGSYTRMYSLMALEAVLLFLAVRRAMELPSRGRLVAVGAATAALLYTHYWDLYLLGAAGAWALWRAWAEQARGRRAPGALPGAARKVLGAMVAGGLTFLPWAPIFVFQVLHTGTPWSAPPGPSSLLDVPGDFAGRGAWATLLAFCFVGLLAVGTFGRRDPHGNGILVAASVQPRARFVGWLLAGTLVLAVAAGTVTGAAFDQRYIAVVFPLFVVVCALGVAVLRHPRAVAAALAVPCLAGLVSAQQWASQPRTQAVEVAADLNRLAQPGDMVVYCPDQLGPAVDRLLRVPNVTELTFPRAIGPARVDWVDYLSVINGTNVGEFAQKVTSMLAPGKRLWLVWRNGYQGFGDDCGNLATWVGMYLPGGSTVVAADSSYYEYENLSVYES
jgi:mannosyltransferase